MSAVIDLTGQRFDRLTVIERDYSAKGVRATWICECDCGKKLSIIGQFLRRKLQTSCGCKKMERIKVLSEINSTHRMSKTPEYRVWSNMIARCHNPKAYQYVNYGARGIEVCSEWRTSFSQFLADMGERPFEGAELDRRDNNKGYSKENCRWVTSTENNNNRRSNRKINFNGEVKTLTEWSRYTDIPAPTISARIGLGWSIEKTLTQPVRGSF